MSTHARARQSDPITSHLAAERVQHSRLEQDVYMHMLSRWPVYLTSIDISNEMGIERVSISPRLRPMYNKGYLSEPIKMQALNVAGHLRLMLGWRVKG